MDSYKVVIRDSASDELRAVPFPFRRQINGRIQKLKKNPRPTDCERVGVAQERFRLKYGDWKILYDIDDLTATITVVEITGLAREALPK